jgi:probable addiction module antidote protein
MPKLNFVDDLKKRLKDPDYALRFLETVLEDGDIQGFSLALRLVAEAKGGVGVLSKKLGKSRSTLYKELGPKGNPTIKNLVSITHELGLKMRFEWETPLAA